ncbi:MAG: restriction endonuclease subunit S [Pontiellaceae bacterium]|nr:restriction endonuclease subunit S [Pontiellaceae bacterium]
MSRIDELIAKHCPDGVEFRAIGEIAELVRGNGMPKSDFVETGVGCIHYGQIYTFYGVWATETISFVSPGKAKKLAKVDPGDLIITNTSENIEDVCKAVAWLGESQIVTGGHATVLKHNQDSKYLSYYFQTSHFFAEKKKHAFGAKVIDVSAKNLAKIRIPVPPLEVQQEIVAVLDRFTKLEAELEAELEARRKQYQHYRDSLLSFDDASMAITSKQASKHARWLTLGEIATIGTGSHDTKDAIEDGDYIFYARGREPLNLNSYDFDETAIITAGDGVGVGKVFHWAEGKYALHQRAYRIVPSDNVAARYIYHYLAANFYDYVQKTSVHSSVTSLRKPMFLKMPIPVPAIDEQERIVSILDKFDALVNDLTAGLPAEINARRQQYEYYRNRLLDFDELKMAS